MHEKIYKILILELWGIGDAVMMSAVLKPLREAFPKAKIFVLCQYHGKEILQENHEVDNFFIFKFPWTVFNGKYYFWRWDWKGLIKIIQDMRREKFDFILDARRDPRNNFLAFLIGAKQRVGYGWGAARFFLTDAIACDNKKTYRVDAWLKVLNYLRASTDYAKPEVCISLGEKKWADDFLKSKGMLDGRLLVGIHPSAGTQIRRWPLDRFAAVGESIHKKYRIRPIIFVDPDGYGEDIILTVDHVKARLNLRQVAALISRLDLLICNDTGVMHIADGVQTPVVAIFGPGDPRYIGPYGSGHRIVIKQGFSCRPCFDQCKFEEPACLICISVEDALMEIDSKIESMVNKNYKQEIADGDF